VTPHERQLLTTWVLQGRPEFVSTEILLEAPQELWDRIPIVHARLDERSYCLIRTYILEEVQYWEWEIWVGPDDPSWPFLASNGQETLQEARDELRAEIKKWGNTT